MKSKLYESIENCIFETAFILEVTYSYSLSILSSHIPFVEHILIQFNNIFLFSFIILRVFMYIYIFLRPRGQLKRYLPLWTQNHKSCILYLSVFTIHNLRPILCKLFTDDILSTRRQRKYSFFSSFELNIQTLSVNSVRFCIQTLSKEKYLHAESQV